MANFDEIIAQNPKAFEGTNVKEQFDGIASKLTGMGFDVLINHREKAEFIPSGRLSEVVKQRDDLKGQIEGLNATIAEMQKAAGGDKELKAQLETLKKQNEDLLAGMDKATLDAEILLAAKEAINAQDVLTFVKLDAIKKDPKTGAYKGIKEEIDRIKSEKPYLFGKRGKAGIDHQHQDEPQAGGMNALIRARAGRV